MLAQELHIDLESRSTIDLNKVGTYNYALHQTTDVWMARFAFDDEELIDEWRPGQPCPDRIVDHVRSGRMIYAWSSQFERTMWKCILARRYGWPMPKLEQWDDPMVWALAMSFPAKLGQCAQALGTRVQKDDAGRRLMLQMAKPRKVHENGAIVWWDQPDKIERLSAYCGTDVATEREIKKHLLPLSPDERENWLLDQRINDRGIKIDLPFVGCAKRVVMRRVVKLNARLQELTSNEVDAATNVSALSQWMLQRGYPTASLDKDSVIKLLKRDDLPEDIKEALRIRQQAGKSSTAKLDAFENATCVDGRARGVFQFHQAGPGRWSSKIIQLHNMPRGAKAHQKQFDELCEAISTGDDDWVNIEFGDPMDAVSSSLRGCLVAPHGKVLVARDFSAIESRKLAWSAGEQWKIDAYKAYDAGTGPDIYKLMYSRAFQVLIALIDSAMRQIGKVLDLSMGYQGGVSAFVSMAANYQMSIPDLVKAAWDVIPEEIKQQAYENLDNWGRRSQGELTVEQWVTCESLKLLFRNSHPATVAYWAALEAAAISAVQYPGKTFRITHEQFAFQDFRYRMANGHLWCRLPSGRALCYPFPHVRHVPTPWGTDKAQLVYMGLNAITKQWERQASYGGHLAENNTQGVGACYQRRAIKACELELDIPVVLHVHDEVVGEVDEARGQEALDAMGRVMRTPPPWAVGCPIASNGFITRRYRKE